jgi:hypothetical protein
MDKKEFLDSLAHCYTRLSATAHGVGVVAIRDIPAGVNPFLHCPEPDFIALSEEDLAGVAEPVLELLRDLCVKQAGVYYAPADGLDAVGKNYYLNHSREPNMITPDEGETFITARDVKKGEELTVDYRTYDEENASFY